MKFVLYLMVNILVEDEEEIIEEEEVNEGVVDYYIELFNLVKEGRF